MEIRILVRRTLPVKGVDTEIAAGDIIDINDVAATGLITAGLAEGIEPAAQPEVPQG